MTQKDKELLLRDLCARLPYGVKVQTAYPDAKILEGIQFPDYIGISDGYYSLDVMECKPYLFPLSSMTEEQKMEIKSLCDGTEIFDDGSWMRYISILGNFNFEINLAVVNWLNANNFDYRGLIPKGLAIDATGLNIY